MAVVDCLDSTRAFTCIEEGKSVVNVKYTNTRGI